MARRMVPQTGKVPQPSASSIKIKWAGHRGYRFSTLVRYRRAATQIPFLPNEGYHNPSPATKATLTPSEATAGDWVAIWGGRRLRQRPRLASKILTVEACLKNPRSKPEWTSSKRICWPFGYQEILFIAAFVW